ncbi:hypothetical protein LSAT2_019086, partial [Lamellibrachia satsuma]
MLHHGHAEAPWRDGLVGLRRTVLPHPCPDAFSALACDQLGPCHGCDTWRGHPVGGTENAAAAISGLPSTDRSYNQKVRTGPAVEQHRTMPLPAVPLQAPRPITPTLPTPVLPHRLATYLVGYARLKRNHLNHGFSVGFRIPSTIICSPHMHGHVNHPSTLIHHQFITSKLA